MLIGDTAEKIAESAKAQGFTKIVFAKNFDEAFEKALDAAKEGNAVLLSPACASWGMFVNYEERGEKFRACVENLEE